MKEFNVSTKHQEELVDITSQVQGVIGQLKVEDGVEKGTVLFLSN